jgi:protein SCO1
VSRTRNAAVLLAAVALLALAGCSGGKDKEQADNPGGAIIRTTQDPNGLRGATLDRPYSLPTATLTDTSGNPFNLVTSTKKPVTLVFFGYTNCPDVCPTTMANVAVALRRLDPAVARDLQVVFVTTDPAFDTPAVLDEYLGRFDADLPTPFIGLTGDQETIDQAQLSTGVPLAEQDGRQHSSLLLLYGSDDEAHVAFDSGNTPQDIAADLGTVAAAA